MADRKFRVSLSQNDSEYLAEIAQKLGTTESDVIRKGLKLMALYVQTDKEPNKALVFKEGDDEKKVMII
jgi:hypothetical protein